MTNDFSRVQLVALATSFFIGGIVILVSMLALFVLRRLFPNKTSV